MKKFIVIISILIALFSFSKYIEYKTTSDRIDQYLQQHQYEEDIASEHVKYEFKLGYFYKEITYKKYPDRMYEYAVYQGAVSGIAFEKGVEIDTTEYLEDAS